MSNLYIRVMTGFYTHRKTIKLRVLIGDAAFWVPPRLWAYCAENQPDGNLSAYSSEELAMLIGYTSNAPSNACSIIQALKDSGYVDSDGFVHDWEEHNGYHKSYSDRAKAAAAARWAKEKAPKPLKEEIGKRKEESGDKHCIKHTPSNAPSITDVAPLPSSIFKKPSIEAIKMQASKIGLPAIEAEKFLNHYESNGWMVGKNKMKSWTHALSNWKNNFHVYASPQMQLTQQNSY